MTFPVGTAELNALLLQQILNPLFQNAITGAGGTTAAGATGTPQLRALLDSIPFANDGEVIRADHFNAIRAALVQIAGALDIDQLSQVVSPIFTPVLLPVAGAETVAWRSAVGFAVGPAAGKVAKGWMPVDLPNQTLIDSLTIRAKMPAVPKIWTVELRRQEVAGSVVELICRKEIQAEPVAGDGTFTATVPVISDGLTPAQLDNRRRVDTSAYRYLIATDVAEAPQADALEIRSLAVTCIRA